MFGLWHESVERFAFTIYKQRAVFENEINQSDVIVSRESMIVFSVNIPRERLFIKKNNNFKILQTNLYFDIFLLLLINLHQFTIFLPLSFKN